MKSCTPSAAVFLLVIYLTITLVQGYQETIPSTLPFTTPSVLEPCDDSSFKEKQSWYFEDACYFAVDSFLSWHRAKTYCEDQGSTLVSIHSTDEIGFIIKLLREALLQERWWIGLHSFGFDGTFQWTDMTPLDFTYFASGKPDSFMIPEKCVHMYKANGEWNDENCNAPFGFICKRINDTSVSTMSTTTRDPLIGNCKKGWIPHSDRCYYIGGKKKKDRVNWTEALDICQKKGGVLTSIRDSKEQAFLSYLMSMLEVDAWIGLHSNMKFERFFWVDNSEQQYTNWKNKFVWAREDHCAKMLYDGKVGAWITDSCRRKKAFICLSMKDPQLPPALSDFDMHCTHPEEWLKRKNMCFKFFKGSLTWKEAEVSCNKEGGHLVSVSDSRVKAAVDYFTAEITQPFFIGLKYDKGSRSFKWLNHFPVTVSYWGENEPSFMSENTCFASTPDGYWQKVSCDEKLPYLCQTTSGKPKIKKFVGNCSSSPEFPGKWISGKHNYCYKIMFLEQIDPSFVWHKILARCYPFLGEHLISLHSMEQTEDVIQLLNPEVKSVIIGLLGNIKGGYSWFGNSPVNFVNWDEGEPSLTGECVEMKTDNMKWRMTNCLGSNYTICMKLKSTLIVEDLEEENHEAESQRLTTVYISLIVISLLISVVITVAVL